jgi:hypothetical protein
MVPVCGRHIEVMTSAKKVLKTKNGAGTASALAALHFEPNLL